MQSIGNLLKKYREEQSISLEEISVRTFIRKSFIEDIENNDFSRFDSHLHARGFIKIICDYLDIEPEPLLIIYKRDFESKNTGFTRKISNFKLKEKDYEQKSSSLKFKLKLPKIENKFLKPAILSTVLILFILIIFSIVRSTFSAPGFVINLPIEIDAPGEYSYNSTFPEIKIEGEVDSETKVFVNDEPVVLEPGDTFRASDISTESEMSVIKINFVSRLGISSEVKLNVTRDLKNIKDEDLYNIVIFVQNKPTFFLARGDGTIQYNDIANQNDAIRLTATRSVEIETNEPENLILQVNGEKFNIIKSIDSFKLSDGRAERKP